MRRNRLLLWSGSLRIETPSSFHVAPGTPGQPASVRMIQPFCFSCCLLAYEKSSKRVCVCGGVADDRGGRVEKSKARPSVIAKLFIASHAGVECRQESITKWLTR